MRLLRRALGALRAVYRPDGFNIGVNEGKVAGAGFAGHVHVHVVPRWETDSNFMAVTAVPAFCRNRSRTPTRRCGRASAETEAPRSRSGARLSARAQVRVDYDLELVSDPQRAHEPAVGLDAPGALR
jgi:hypothetical protein